MVALRKSKAFIPQLSLVAVEDQRVVGYILFTKAVVNGVQVLALAPLAGHGREYQNRGIGLAPIAEGHRAARSLGYGYSGPYPGHRQHYPKAGYLPASRYGIRAPFPVADENFMAICLNAEPKPLDGIMEYDPAFWHITSIAAPVTKQKTAPTDGKPIGWCGFLMLKQQDDF